MAAAPRTSARAVLESADMGAHWAPLAIGDWIPVVALCLPETLAQDLVAWAAAKRLKPHQTSDDANVGTWALERRITCYATIPALVQHDVTVPSLMGNAPGTGPNPNRVALCWIGDHDGRTIAW